MAYDGDGNRVSETIGGTTTKFLVDDRNPTGLPQVLDELVNGSVTRTYAYGLQRISENQQISRARQLSRSSGKTENIYGEVRDFATLKWPCLRRVVIKAEVVRAPEKDPKDNPRFVITNMKQSPQWIYEQVSSPILRLVR